MFPYTSSIATGGCIQGHPLGPPWLPQGFPLGPWKALAFQGPKGNPRGTQGELKGDPRGTQGGPKGHPRGTPGCPRGAHDPQSGAPRPSKRAPKVHLKSAPILGALLEAPGYPKAPQKRQKGAHRSPKVTQGGPKVPQKRSEAPCIVAW